MANNERHQRRRERERSKDRKEEEEEEEEEEEAESRWTGFTDDHTNEKLWNGGGGRKMLKY